MRLILLHPEVAFRDCEHCKRFLYDASGNPVPTREAEIAGSDDGPYRERDQTCPPECRTQKGCPKGSPEKPKSLTPANYMAYQHYRECKATGTWPDDPIVKRNAVLIRDIEEYAGRMQKRLEFEQTKQLLMVSQITQIGKGLTGR